MMSKCKSCGAEIVWIKMKSGKSMPCNPRGIHYREQVHGDEGCMLTLVTPDGNVVVGQACEENESELLVMFLISRLARTLTSTERGKYGND